MNRPARLYSKWSDNGQGIDPAYLNRVFEMYFRANEKSKGNGLGLYIVKKMTDKLNGQCRTGSANMVWAQPCVPIYPIIINRKTKFRSRIIFESSKHSASQ